MFIEIPANRMSLSKRKPIYGVGVNDADYVISKKVDGKITYCPFYKSWLQMLGRCYCSIQHKTHPTYVVCTVTDKWLTFSSFKAWMKKQDWKGKQLDKDILIQGNKTYSPEACIFVTKEINHLLMDGSSFRGNLPRGVCYNQKRETYQANCKVNGKGRHLGYYDTPEESSDAYNEFKYAHIARIAEQQTEPLKAALLAYKIK